jgi:hypothetical protein
LATHTADVAEHDLFAPIFRGVAHLVQVFKTFSWSGEVPAFSSPRHGRVGPFRAVFEGFLAAVRRGNIQVRLTHIVVTLVVVFVVEFAMTHRSAVKSDISNPKIESVSPKAEAGSPTGESMTTSMNTKGLKTMERSRP